MVKKWKMGLMCLTGTLFVCLTCGCAGIPAILAAMAALMQTGGN